MNHPLATELAKQDRSASWLSKKAGFDPSYAHKVMSGDRTPSPEFRRRVAQILGVPETALFPATDSSPAEVA